MDPIRSSALPAQEEQSQDRPVQPGDRRAAEDASGAADTRVELPDPDEDEGSHECSEHRTDPGSHRHPSSSRILSPAATERADRRGVGTAQVGTPRRGSTQA